MIAGLATRLALRLVLLAALIVAGAAWFSLVQVRRVLEGELEAELDRMERGMQTALVEVGEELAADLDGMVDRLRAGDEDLLLRLMGGEGDLTRVAGILASRTRLDALEFRDGEGWVLSSTWAERAGLRAEGEPGTGLVRLVLADRRRPGLAQRREIISGRRMLVISAGRELGTSFLLRFSGHGAAMLIDAEGGTPIVSRPSHPVELRGLAEALRSEGEDGTPLRLEDAEGSRWQVRSAALNNPGGPPLATVVVAVNRDGLESTLRRLRHGFVVLGLAAALLAALAGIVIARGITRPVRELVRAFDAAAAGEADYSLPATRQNELQELIVSVSRLRRALETQQRRSVAAERVATWRDVARHVAHEVKNPLAPIRLTVENLLRARASAPERFDTMFSEGMGTILEEVEQLRRMVEEFSAFARLPLPTLRPEQLERIVDGVLDLHASEPGLELRRRFCGDLPAVPLDADQLSRALKNVIGNAVQAMRETGETKLPLRVATFVEDGMACVEVADRGPGFSTESRRRVFEPYFTTRDGGTGLGMALTYRIIIDHGGTVTAENRTGGGAVVTLRLPLEQESA